MKSNGTEIEKIPEDWESGVVSEAISINPKRELKKSSQAKYVSMADIEPYTKKIASYITRKFSSGSKFQNGDTLLARITPCLENGKTAFVNILDFGEVGWGSTEFIVLCGKEEKTDSEFVYYLARSPYFRNIAIRSMSGTSGRQRVQEDILSHAEVLIPPLPEQRAIVKILSDTDAKIELNRQMNATLEEMAEALFKHWFVDFEFPNEQGKPYKSSGGKMVESELGDIPEGWEVRKVNDFVDLAIGRTPPRMQTEWFSESAGIPWISIKDMGHSETYIIKTSEFLTPIAVKKFRIPIIKKGTPVVSFKLTVGRVAITSTEMLSNEAIAQFNVPENILSTEYLYLFLKNFDYTSLGSTSSIATAVNSESLRMMNILIPESGTLKKFNSVVKSIFDKIFLESIESMNLEVTRDSLLPKLMSGKIRVAEVVS